MSDTKKHKILGKFNNGIECKIPMSVKKLWRRHNNDIGEFRHKRKVLLEKILKNELNQIKADCKVKC